MAPEPSRQLASLCRVWRASPMRRGSLSLLGDLSRRLREATVSVMFLPRLLKNPVDERHAH